MSTALSQLDLRSNSKLLQVHNLSEPVIIRIAQSQRAEPVLITLRPNQSAFFDFENAVQNGTVMLVLDSPTANQGHLGVVVYDGVRFNDTLTTNNTVNATFVENLVPVFKTEMDLQ